MFVVNKTPVDPFTLVHGAAGIAARKYGLSFSQTLALGFAWDYFVEPVLKKSNPDLFPYPSPDAPTHAFVDAITPAMGWVAYDVYLKGNCKR